MSMCRGCSIVNSHGISTAHVHSINHPHPLLMSNMSKNILLLIFIGVICPMFPSKAANHNSHSSNNIRLYFPTEKGVEKVVLERQRIGARLPTRTDIEDFNSGYYDIILDKATTFSAIAFDADKNSRIIPISMNEQMPSYAGSGKRDKANYLSMWKIMIWFHPIYGTFTSRTSRGNMWR